MGNCNSAAGSAPSSWKDNNSIIDTFLDSSRKIDLQVFKVLLLGPADAGKTTFWKQMLLHYGEGFSDTKRLSERSRIRFRVALMLLDLTKACDFEVVSNVTRVFISTMLSYIDYESRCKFDLSWVVILKGVWSDPEVQRAWEERAKNNGSNTLGYFMDRLDEMAEVEYVPSIDDFMRIRISTTGAVETTFCVGRDKFKLVDVGGQRSERRKWLRLFDQVSGVIFLAAVGEYDQVLEEDGRTNRVQESLDLFEDVAVLRHFSSTCFVLFLNKIDLLKEKLGNSSVAQYFPKYTGDPEDYDAVLEFFQGRFRKRWRKAGKSDSALFIHNTCALDSENCRLVMLDVKAQIVRSSLNNKGMI